MTRFDVFVMVDWSASATPKSGADSIWVATLDATSGDMSLTNHRTRAAASEALRRTLADAVARRVLVGYDFPLGYPATFAASLGSGPAHWRNVWGYLAAAIVDDDRNRNNRFDVAARLNAATGSASGPFWGCPGHRASATLDPRKHGGFPVMTRCGALAEYRLAEQRLRAGGRRPFSAWQLYGNGSVGGQALVGIPVVARLLDDPQLARRSHVWPFTTSCGADLIAGAADAIVHAEIWPGLVAIDRTRHAVKDAAQVIGVCEHLAALDRAGRLDPQFAPELTDDEARSVVREEGWILGVP